LLILFISLVVTDDQSGRSAWNSNPDYACYKTLKYTIETQFPENPNEYNPWEWETPLQSTRLTLPGEGPVLKNIDLPAVLVHTVLSNPFLLDLPPPAPLIIS
jgi:hypothetical protein